MAKSDNNENDGIIINYIRQNNGKYSKSELAEAMHFPWSTMSITINNLMKDNHKQLNIEKNENENKNKYGGKISINPCFQYYVGISVGHSQIKIVILDFSFSIVKVESFINNEIMYKKFGQFTDEVHKKGFKDFKDFKECKWCCETPNDTEKIRVKLIELTNSINELKDKNFNIVGIGFAFPEHIDDKSQKIIYSFHEKKDGGFQNINITSLLSTSLMNTLQANNIQCFIEHNVKCSTIAEKESIVTYKPSYNAKNIINVYMGRGLSMGLVLNDELYRGNQNKSGEYGKYRFIDSDICLEEKLNPDNLSQSKEEKEKFVRLLCFSLCNIINVLGIDKIIFSGKFDEIFSIIELPMMNTFYSLNKSDVSLIQSTYGKFLAAVGAAMSCYYKLNNIDFSWN